MKNIIFTLVIASLLIFTGCNKDVQNSEKPPKNENKVEIKKDKIELVTQDMIKLAADYYYYSDKKDSLQPLIILIHQFRSNKEQWDKSFIDSLLNKNYKVFAFDLRNHGESGKATVDLMELLSDREQAPNDVDAVMKWAFNLKGIDTAKIGIVGTSIGGSLALYGRIFKGAKSVVAISSGKGTFQAFTGYDDRMMSSMRPILRTKNVMFICGTADNNYLEEEKSIYDNYLMDPREIIKFESDKHGKDLIAQHPEILTLIVNWFGKTL
jgi:pimeloyl-ACP methyl ester carboxylesterase